MLILSRKSGQQILVGDGSVITVNGTQGGRVSLAIEAPRDVRILRGELRERDAAPSASSATVEGRRPACV